MKVLLIGAARGPDYMADMTLHGFRTNLGADAIDYPRVDYMYDDYPAAAISSLYGHGFTLYGLLDSRMPIDRSNIAQRIAEREFSLVVYTSIHRDQSFLSHVLDHYARHEVIFVDGEDQSHGLFGMATKGIYLKRELYDAHPGIHPIHFAIPASKIGTCGPLAKTQVRATIDPRDRTTYTYIDEHSYYADYHRSLFGLTCRKGGWDCLRHLEVMANGSIPLFLDLDQCPPLTCIHLPKPELLEALTLMDKDAKYWESNEGRAVWLSLWRRTHLKFSRYCTTSALAQHVIEIAEREASLAGA